MEKVGGLRRDGRGMEWCGVEGGRGSRAHSPELVVACGLVLSKSSSSPVSSSLVSHSGHFCWWLFVHIVVCG